MSTWRAIGQEAHAATDRLRRPPYKKTFLGEEYDTWSAQWLDANNTLYQLVVREQDDQPGPATLLITETTLPGELAAYTGYIFYPDPWAADDEATITPDNPDPDIDGYLSRRQGFIDMRNPEAVWSQNAGFELARPTPNDVQELLNNILLHKQYRTQPG